MQDYTECKRRFQLRYLDRLAWPALETEPALLHEQFMHLGARFHQLVQQHQLGLPVDRLTRQLTDPILSRWWDNYLAHIPPDLPPKRLTETVLTASLAGHQLLARYDLLAVEPNRAVIVDWKTSRPNARRPQRSTLADRLQTRVYRYTLVEAGAHLNGGQPFQPEQVEMIYWFAEYPDQPLHFPYTTDRYRADREYLTGLINEIKALQPDRFTLTPDENRCAYCPYRSLCNRGTRAGDFDEWDGDSDPALSLDFDLEQIAEIEF